MKNGETRGFKNNPAAVLRDVSFSHNIIFVSKVLKDYTRLTDMKRKAPSSHTCSLKPSYLPHIRIHDHIRHVKLKKAWLYDRKSQYNGYC